MNPIFTGDMIHGPLPSYDLRDDGPGLKYQFLAHSLKLTTSSRLLNSKTPQTLIETGSVATATVAVALLR